MSINVLIERMRHFYTSRLSIARVERTNSFAAVCTKVPLPVHHVPNLPSSDVGTGTSRCGRWIPHREINFVQDRHTSKIVHDSSVWYEKQRSIARVTAVTRLHGYKGNQGTPTAIPPTVRMGQ